jgi:mono/diheme cytochrome c family protein
MRRRLACVASVLAACLPAASTAQDTATPIAAWSRTQASAEDTGTLRERGAAVFNNWCDACHRDAETNAPGTRSLALKYRGELPAALEDRTDLTPELVRFYVRNGVATMPFYRPTEISNEDLEALSAYLAP